MEVVYLVYLRNYDDIIAGSEGTVVGVHSNIVGAENQGKLITHMTGTNFLPNKYVIKEFSIYTDYETFKEETF